MDKMREWSENAYLLLPLYPTKGGNFVHLERAGGLLICRTSRHFTKKRLENEFHNAL